MKRGKPRFLPLLVTGITGVAGYNAFRWFRQRFPGRVIGIRPRNGWRLRGEGIVALDAEDADGMRRLFEHFRFRAVLNCHGNCALKSCELDPAMARRLNVDAAEIIAANSTRQGCRLVHLSTDLVFSGNGNGHYRESDPVDPVTVYGKTMAIAESLIREGGGHLKPVPSPAIVRISLPMGPSFNRHAGAIDWIQSRFRAGRPATLYYDEVRSCTYVGDLNRVFEWFLTHDASGLFHAGGPRPISLYQIAQIVNRMGGYDPQLLKGCPRREAGPVPPRAGNVSLCSDKLAALMAKTPFAPWPAEPALLPTDPHWHYERDSNFPGSFHQIQQRLYAYSAGSRERKATA